jgi:hypothetical protein
MASHKRRREPNEFAQQDAAGRSGLIFELVAQATSVMEAEFNARREPRRADTSLTQTPILRGRWNWRSAALFQCEPMIHAKRHSLKPAGDNFRCTRRNTSRQGEIRMR